MVANSGDDSDSKTESQKEWADWAAHGYRKLYQPRSVRRFGVVFSLIMFGGLLTVYWLAADGHLP